MIRYGLKKSLRKKQKKKEVCLLEKLQVGAGGSKELRDEYKYEFLKLLLLKILFALKNWTIWKKLPVWIR